MLLNLPYIKCYKITGDIKNDAVNLLIANSHEKTAAHCIAVANTCAKFARKFNLNEETAYLSGVLHDVSAIVKPPDMLDYARRNNWYVDESESKYNFILHQRISTVIAKDYFGVMDKSILSAIECHSTLKANASEYDMLLFLSDKISWDQDGTPEFLDVILKSLDFSLANASLTYINYVLDNGMIRFAHKWLIEAKEWLEKGNTI